VCACIFVCVRVCVCVQLKCATHMKIPIVATEQYPKALGRTVAELDISSAKKFEKLQFSMMTDPVREYLKSLVDVKSVILVGVETHVCVLQTALDLTDAGYDVHVLADGVSSQRAYDRAFAFQRLRKESRVFLTTSESAGWYHNVHN